MVLKSPHDLQLTQSIKFSFPIANNKAKYEAVLLGLKLALALDVAKIDIRCDSRLIVSQIKGEFEAKEDRMIKYLSVTKTILAYFKQFFASQVPIIESVIANLASSVPLAYHVHV